MGGKGSVSHLIMEVFVDLFGTIKFWSQKGGKLNIPKTPKIGKFNINLLGKVLISTQNPIFKKKINP